MLKLSKKLIIKIFSGFFLPGLFALQFGNGNDESSNVFIKVEENVRLVASSDIYSTYMIKNDDSLWGTGLNIYKGIKENKVVRKFEKLMDDVLFYDGEYLIKKDNSLWIVDKEIHKLDDNVKKIISGVYLKTDGTLLALGENTHGAFGIGKKNVCFQVPEKILSNVEDFYFNGMVLQVILNNGKLLVSGEHYLPVPYKDSVKFFQLAENVRETGEGYYVTRNNELFSFGFFQYGALGIGNYEDIKTTGILPQKIMENVLTVSSNQCSRLILNTKGDLYGCGGGDKYNYCGELGLGTDEEVNVPTFIMSNVKSVYVLGYHTAIIKKDDSLWMCGGNNAFVGGY